MNKLLTTLLAGLFAASLSFSAMALDATKTTDTVKKAVDSVKSTAVTPAAKPAVVAPAAAAPVVATPAAPVAAATTETKTEAKPMSHKKHKHGKKAAKK